MPQSLGDSYGISGETQHPEAIGMLSYSRRGRAEVMPLHIAAEVLSSPSS